MCAFTELGPDPQRAEENMAVFDQSLAKGDPCGQRSKKR